MRPTPLEESEAAPAVRDGVEIIFLEFIKGLSPDELLSFRVYTPNCPEHYSSARKRWAGYLHGEKVTGEMEFHVYYVLKYLQFVTRT